MNKDWDNNYKLICEYYKQNGNLDIMAREKICGVELGTWLGKIRQAYRHGHLSADKIKLLEQLNINWEDTADSIQIRRMIKMCEEYYEKHGNLNITINTVSDNGYRIGMWFIKQKTKCNNNTINPIIKKELDNIYPTWNSKIVSDSSPASKVYQNKLWEEYYSLVEKYYKEHGNIDLVWRHYVEDKNIGYWIRTQRDNYKKGLLSSDKIEKLEKLGMVWDNPRSVEVYWNKMYQILKDYYSKYKHLFIPMSYITPDGEKLGIWLHTQKINLKKGKLSEEKIKKLDALDITWREKTVTSTSFPEQAIMYYIKKIFPNAYKFKSKEISEIDIFIPEIKIGIEYDGNIHQDVEKDTLKTMKCKKNGIKLIRVREPNCPIIKDGSTIIKLDDLSNQSLEKAIAEIFNYLNISETKTIDLEKDTQEIMDTYIKGIDLQWYEMYDELKKYYEKNNNSRVPLDFITESGKRLGIWVNSQRDGRKNNGRLRTLSSQKIQLLDDLEMDWSPLENDWNFGYEQAAKYFKENGDLLVNINYKIDEYPLGVWISTQRGNYKNNSLLQDKINKLEKIGMVWDPIEKSWFNYYKIVEKYFKKNGNIEFPYSYKMDGKNIGLWIGTQRQKYKNGLLSKDRIRLLELININWEGNTPDYLWDEWYKLIKEYYDEIGTINVANTLKYKGKNIGVWINNQRTKYKQKKLEQSQIEKLEKLGILWNPLKDKWNYMYELAKKYYQENGDLLIADLYKENGIALGKWVSQQRRNYKMKNQCLTEQQIDMLNSIGMVWDVNEAYWQQMYEMAKIYFKENGNLLIPDTYVKNGIALGRWIGTQRQRYKKENISSNEVKLLEEIGISWDVYEDNWNVGYKYAKEYYLKNKTLSISNNYIVNGINLTHWIQTQKKAYSSDKLSNDKKQLLREIGIESSTLEGHWDELYSLAKNYYEEHGELLIPRKYKVGKINLGAWLGSQRDLYNSKKLSDDRIKKLEQIGMNWNPIENQWNDWYKLAEDYYKINKNLNISNRYITKDGEKLGIWIANQKTAYKNNKLSNDQIERLNKIGIEWSTKLVWDDFYRCALEYYKLHGNLNLKTREEFNGIKLGWWILNQKRNFKYNKISKDHIQKLKDLGIL